MVGDRVATVLVESYFFCVGVLARGKIDLAGEERDRSLVPQLSRCRRRMALQTQSVGTGSEDNLAIDRVQVANGALPRRKRLVLKRAHEFRIA